MSSRKTEITEFAEYSRIHLPRCTGLIGECNVVSVWEGEIGWSGICKNVASIAVIISERFDGGFSSFIVVDGECCGGIGGAWGKVGDGLEFVDGWDGKND